MPSRVERSKPSQFLPRGQCGLRVSQPLCRITLCVAPTHLADYLPKTAVQYYIAQRIMQADASTLATKKRVGQDSHALTRHWQPGPKILWPGSNAGQSATARGIARHVGGPLELLLPSRPVRIVCALFGPPSPLLRSSASPMEKFWKHHGTRPVWGNGSDLRNPSLSQRANICSMQGIRLNLPLVAAKVASRFPARPDSFSSPPSSPASNLEWDQIRIVGLAAGSLCFFHGSVMLPPSTPPTTD